MSDKRSAVYNGDNDDDEALRIAMALSLGQDPNIPKPAIDLTAGAESDDDEIEIVSSPAPGKQTPRSARKRNAAPLAPEDPRLPPVNDTPKAASSLSALGMDRKKMEEERLARVNKRKAADALDAGGVSSMSEARPYQRPKLVETVTGSTVSISGLAHAKPLVNPQPVRVAGYKPLKIETKSFSTSILPFPHGRVKRTWVKGQPRTADDITIEELLQSDKLDIAVLSSYQWNEEWLLTKIDITHTRMVFIRYAADEAHQDELRAIMASSRIHLCFPPMNGPGSMHSKLQLLKYDNYLRIAVPTANLVPYDWGETGVMENMVFIIDLPKFKTNEERDAQKLTQFAEDLIYFLEAQHLEDKLIQSLRNYDFSETSRYAFVHTIAGSHTSSAWKRTGYCGLGRAVSALNLGSNGPIDMDYVCASLGAANYDLLRALYYAFQGDSGLKEYESRTSGRKGERIAGIGDDVDTLKRHIRVYFPSLETVAGSLGGKDSAGTICLTKRWWEAPSFPKEVLRDCKSTRNGVLMHSKVVYIRAPSNLGFAYVGSSNLSESAWGRLVKDRGTGQPKLTCRNWECGVLISPSSMSPVPSISLSSPVPEENKSNKTTAPGEDLNLFRGFVPIPMVFPSFPLGSEGSKMPWFYRDG